MTSNRLALDVHRHLALAGGRNRLDTRMRLCRLYTVFRPWVGPVPGVDKASFESLKSLRLLVCQVSPFCGLAFCQSLVQRLSDP